MKIFARIKRLVGYTARLAQLNIGVAIQGLLTRKGPAAQYELPSETEYYSLIADEVSRLPNNTHVARQALYDRTWVAIAAQLLRGQDPPASDPQVAREHLSFQRAICKVEVGMAIQGNAQEKKQREQVREKHRRRPF
jgi:hypothetical protein